MRRTIGHGAIKQRRNHETTWSETITQFHTELSKQFKENETLWNLKCYAVLPTPWEENTFGTP